jgi:hypothetical protein
MYGSFAVRRPQPGYPWAPAPEERARHVQRLKEGWGGIVHLAELAPSVIGDEELSGLPTKLFGSPDCMRNPDLNVAGYAQADPVAPSPVEPTDLGDSGQNRVEGLATVIPASNPPLVDRFPTSMGQLGRILALTRSRSPDAERRRTTTCRSGHS